ncbi:chymotrypsin-like elastase family member 1 [Callorhinchus milii]|uniref:chymotrypsin-like elastase family member 1 n=1 Tax=Callorhinchus milii TaxID=7868 RepID=UPI0004571EB5|nr:chymotrypsin-like elastase family member 1 [Callorhinchus milii]|eukprot:gi/632983285/ref/XP_007908571.1/ PREDICTED: chymotrypsin-like elastase family member 1 [Callorhinchus milii]
MFPCLVFLLALGAVCGLPAKRYPLTKQPHLGRVIGGQEAVPHSWKWQISLQVTYDSNPTGFWHTCGGTIIHYLYVMTAAHCVDSPSGKIYRVGFGEHDLSVDEGTEYYLDVESIHVHPYWNPSSLASGYDIALLKLKDPVYDNSYVEIAILPVEGQILPSQSECYITGWGLTSPNGSGATRLQQAGLSVVSYEICSRPEWWGATVNDRMICAGGDGYSSGCQGDSGGPFACKSNDGYWSVHGIVSFGPIYCNIYEKPTVFTRVSAYLDWIFQIINE